MIVNLPTIGAYAHPTIHLAGLAAMTAQARMEQFKSAPSQFVDPQKERGERTAKQVSLIEGIDHARDMVAKIAEQAFFESLPNPPDSQEMIRLSQESYKVSQNLYAAHPVKNFPFPKVVLDSYKTIQEGSVWDPVTKLNELYA